jgi:hypothetical protein
MIADRLRLNRLLGLQGGPALTRNRGGSGQIRG